MPTRLAAPVLTVDAAKMHKVDTSNVENLFSMWTVFSKCANSLEEGRRLENLSWRLWNRETFCCSPETQAAVPADIIDHCKSSRSVSEDMPELSASVESAASEEAGRIGSSSNPQSAPLDILRPTIRRESFESRSRGRERHITPNDLEKMVMTIKEKKELEPLSPSLDIAATFAPEPASTDMTPRPSSPLEDSAVIGSTESDRPASPSQAVGSDASTESQLSSHSIIRGFSQQQPSSYRSQTRLAPAPVVGVNLPSKSDRAKKRKEMFIFGGSSGEEDSSLDDHMKPQRPHRSSLSDGLKGSGSSRKQTSFTDDVVTKTISEGANEDDEVFTSDDDEDVVSESAIDDDDSSDWEDSVSASGQSSVDEKRILFQRVDSKPNLVSRRSLLTNLLHQPQRAAALANAASRSTPAMQRSRTASPNGPSVAASPEEDAPLSMRGPGVPRSKPIVMNTSTSHPPMLSPRTTRRNMLSTELTESLRRHLLWERQQKNTTASAVLKRRHTAHDVANLQEYPGQKSGGASKDGKNSWNHYFDTGPGEYHQKGW